jgi:hypothetical protein
MQAALAEAVEEARRIRGTVMFAADRRERRWCAVCAAVDGRVELRVGEPPRRGLWRRGPDERVEWLRGHGFLPVPDAWSLPMPAAAGSETCAGTLAAALRSALGADAGASLHHVLTNPGLPAEGAPPAEAPQAEHLAAALRALVAGGEGRLDVDGGRPSRPWAFVWVESAGTLLVECELPATDGSADEWREPMTPAGADAAARRLMARIEAAVPGAADEPFYLTFVA